MITNVIVLSFIRWFGQTSVCENVHSTVVERITTGLHFRLLLQLIENYPGIPWLQARNCGVDVAQQLIIGVCHP